MRACVIHKGVSDFLHLLPNFFKVGFPCVFKFSKVCKPLPLRGLWPYYRYIHIKMVVLPNSARISVLSGLPTFSRTDNSGK